MLKEGSFYIDPGLGLSSIFAEVPDDQSSGLASRRLKANVRMDIVDVRVKVRLLWELKRLGIEKRVQASGLVRKHKPE